MKAKRDTKSNYSSRTIAIMSVGFGSFGLIFIGLQSGWQDGIAAGVIIGLATVVFGVVMRWLQSRKRTISD